MSKTQAPSPLAKKQPLPLWLVRRFLSAQLPLWLYILLFAAAVGGRLLIAYAQRVQLFPESSALDDMLMVRAAQSMVEGDWLGAYGAFTMAKHMGFAVWLALLHVLGIPLLVANAVLGMACAAFAVYALSPLFRGRLCRLVLFCFFVFQPFNFAQFNMRAYRDAIFPAFCLLAFAGMVGLCLRLCQKKTLGSAFCAIGVGVGLAGAWLLREDGIVLMVFVLCALLVFWLGAFLCKSSVLRIRKALLALLSLVIWGATLLAYMGMNYAHYGVFLATDLTDGTFSGAYGAMTAVSQSEGEFVAQRPVSMDSLYKMCAEVPSLAPLLPHLEEGSVKNGFKHRTQENEFGGSFYYALKLAADYAGLTPTAQAAQDYWRQVQAEIELAVSEGRLNSETPSTSILPKWDASLFSPTIAEMGNSLLATLTFWDSSAAAPRSEGTPQAINDVATFLHSPTQYTVENIPQYSFVQNSVYILCDVIVWLYRIAIWPLLALALWQMARALRRGCVDLFKSKQLTPQLVLGVLMLGLLLSYLLRLVVSAYMEVASFSIGTYVMYLSSAMPALLVLCAVGLAVFGKEQTQEDI